MWLVDWISVDDSVGWVAAGISALAFGTYGTAVKATLKVDVHPLVLQTYKMLVFCATCWIVTPLLGESISSTPWGLVSGLLYTPGSMCGIFAIRTIGTAASIGTWSSVIVLMNFVWGLLVFQERVKNFQKACMAFGLLLCGLIGMSRYSAASRTSQVMSKPTSNSSASNGNLTSTQEQSLNLLIRKRSLESSDTERAESLQDPSLSAGPTRSQAGDSTGGDNYAMTLSTKKERLILLGGRLSLSLHQCGILGAVMNGMCSGSTLIPMHYAKQEGYSRAGFLISFGTSSWLVALGVWVMLYGWRLYQARGSFKEAFGALPRLYLREMWFAGFMAGILVSIAFISSIVAVGVLGQATGNSLVQCKILVSGLWGIYFGEFGGRDVILKWFLSASIAIVGILLLGYEHESIGDANSKKVHV